MIDKLKYETDFRKETGTPGIIAYDKYLEEYFLWLEKKYTKLKAIQVEAKVKHATCGFCKDCKFWNAENAECTNDVIFINKDIATGYISDFKTQNFFGCIKFESKLSV